MEPEWKLTEDGCVCPQDSQRNGPIKRRGFRLHLVTFVYSAINQNFHEIASDRSEIDCNTSHYRHSHVAQASDKGLKGLIVSVHRGIIPVDDLYLLIEQLAILIFTFQGFLFSPFLPIY